MSVQGRAAVAVSMLFLLLMSCITGWGAQALAASAVDYTRYNGFTIPAEPVLPSAEVHPSLWLREADLPALRSKHEGSTRLRILRVQIERHPLLSAPLPAVPADSAPAETVRSYYAEMPRLAKYNAFAWLLLEDDKYLERAVAALMRAYDGPIYGLDPRQPDSPVDEIYRATWLQNYCEAYDWVQSALTSEQDSAIRARLAREAQAIYENLYVWAPRPHNHLSKPAWALGTAALTLSSHPQARAWLVRALEASNRNTSYFFSADGVYREGAHYYVYSAINFIPFLYHYKNVAGVDLFPAFRPAFTWPLLVRNGKGWLPNIGDSFIKPAPLHLVAREYMDEPTELHPEARLGNLLMWSYINTDLTPWRGGSYTGASEDDTFDILEYLTWDESIEPVAPAVSGTVFLPVGGQTVFRNDWSYNDPAHRYLLFHGVAWADNHNHADTLSFVLQAVGQMMAADAGYSRQGYSDKERTAWYATPAAHNVVTADGESPFTEETPVSRYAMNMPGFAFEEKEAPYAAGGKQVRAIAFVAGDYFVVADTLWHHVPRRYDLYLHGGRATMSGSGNHRLFSYRTDAYGRAARLGAWLFPATAQLADLRGELTYIKGDYASYPYVRATQTADNAQFMQILIPRRTTENMPVVRDVSTSGAVGAWVHENQTDDYFLLQQGTGQARAGALVSDGSFSYLRLEAGQPTQVMMREGTVLAHEERVIARTNGERVTLALSNGDPGRLVATVFTPDREVGLTLAVPAGWAVADAHLNGQLVEWHELSGEVQLRLTGSGQLSVNLKPSP